MNNLKTTALEMSLKQLKIILRNEEIEQQSIKNEIALYEKKIQGLKFNETVKQTTIDALSEIISKKNEYLIMSDDYINKESNENFNPFKDE